jgi:predicted XRE-type DNA-binding protein
MAPRATRKTRQKRIDAIPVTRGSGNVFADLGFPNPEEHLAKAQLVSLIDDVIRERKLTQRQAAKLLGVDQPKVSRILRGRFAGFSTHRLMDFLTSLGCDIDILVKPSPRSRKLGRIRIEAVELGAKILEDRELARVPGVRQEDVESGAELLQVENESFASADARMVARGSVAARERLATARGKGGPRSRRKTKQPSPLARHSGRPK